MIFTYEPYEDGIRLNDYEGEEEHLEIPESIDGKAVKALGSSMFFRHRNEIVSMVIPGCVKVLESNALEGCSSLKHLVLKEGIERLERNFAEMTGIESLRIPASVNFFDHPMDCSFQLEFAEKGFYYSDGIGIYRKNEDYTLSFCGFSYDSHPNDYKIANGTKEILPDAMRAEESLIHLSLPASISEIAEGALCTSACDFRKSKALQNISIEQNGSLAIQKDCLILKKKTGTELILYLGSDSKPVLPSVREISSLAFCNQGFHEITIPSSVQMIYPDAFYGCDLYNIHFDKTDSDLYFPLRHQTLREELMSGFGRNGKMFDYSYYDNKICQPFLSAERVRLMVQRLYQPVGLSIEIKERFTQILSDKLLEAVALAAKEADDASILHMEELQLINSENLDQVMQTLAPMNRTALTSKLLVHCQQHPQNQDLFL